MSEPKQNLFILAGILTFWVLAFGWSVFGSWAMEPTGDGFTRGSNRLVNFLGWQAIATCLALAAFGVGRAWPKGSGTRVVSRLPLWLACALAIGLAAYIGYAILVGG
ncbi:MAG: hypothetical protein AAGO57_08790 [Pseudomonadota bacterium]